MLWLLDLFVSVATATCYPTFLVPETFTEKEQRECMVVSIGSFQIFTMEKWLFNQAT